MKQIIPYLNFDGDCKAAMTFYAKCLGGELVTMPFGDMPGGGGKSAPDRLMHANISLKGQQVLMASDTMPGQPRTAGTNFSISLMPESVEEIERLFAAFSENAKVEMPLADQFWGAKFGTLTDQFGVQWMFNYEYPKK